MQRLTVCLVAMVALTVGATAVHAQSLFDPGKLYVPPPLYFPGTQTVCGSNVGRNDNTKAQSPKEKEMKKRKDNLDAAKKKRQDAEQKLARHKEQMKRDNDLRGQPPYDPGWIHYPGGSKQEDATYNRLESERQHAEQAEHTAQKLYDEAK